MERVVELSGVETPAEPDRADLPAVRHGTVPDGNGHPRHQDRRQRAARLVEWSRRLTISDRYTLLLMKRAVCPVDDATGTPLGTGAFAPTAIPSPTFLRGSRPDRCVDRSHRARHRRRRPPPVR